ncbi:hypothetical protein SDJN02_10708, partial [Cucurbita argyrosperma subsp. argyrosperma]
MKIADTGLSRASYQHLDFSELLERQTTQLQYLGVFHLVLVAEPLLSRRRTSMVVVIINALIVYFSSNSIIIILPFAPEDFYVPTPHILSIPLQCELNLHRASEDNKGLSHEPPILVDQQHIHNVQSSKELENVNVRAVEGKPSKANHRKGMSRRKTPIAIWLKSDSAAANCE